MTNIIDIRDFSAGTITFADAEDLPVEALTVCKNMRPIAGKLIKTFGFGLFVNTTKAGVDNLTTYIHPNAQDVALYNPDRGCIYIAVVIDNTTKVASVYGLYNYLGGSQSWQLINYFLQENLGETFYHKNAKNPIISEGGILRILPGNVGLADGTNESKGIWVGYVDRKIFDEFLTITADFYGYPTNIEVPSLTVTQQWLGDPDSIFKEDDIYYYKFSFVYDGVQESLLSSYYRWEVGADYRANVLKFQITKSTFNKRITAIKVYRSTNEETDYRYIHTINLLRKQTDFFGDINGAYSGRRWIYVPALTTHDFDADNGGDGYDSYQIIIDATGTPDNIEIADQYGSGTGNIFFNIEDGEDDITEKYINEDWKLQGKLDAGEWVDLEAGGSGSYAGQYFIFVNKDLSGDDVNDSYIVFREGSNRMFRKVSNYYEKRAVECSALIDTYYGDQAWRIFLTNKGSFAIEDGTDVQFLFLDRSFIADDEYYLAGEKSIKVNGKFAKIILERLWQANLVLDPGTENESHQDWASFSEIGMFDVTPVSNVERIIDREGGAITGIAEIFNNPVFLKPQAVITFNAKYHPSEPEQWSIMESIHNVGNLADEGYIEVLGNLYICYHDGLYRLRPSNLSPADQTPTEHLKITKAIEDVYLALTLTQKKAIKSEYDPIKNEIVFTLGSAVWAFNIDTEKWREISTGVTITIMTKDESANILIYDSTDSKIYSSNVKESVKFDLKLKTFSISDIRPEVVRKIYLTYKSEQILTVKLYVENGAVAVWTGTLALSATIITKVLACRYRAKKFTFSIEDVLGTTDAEINSIKIEHT